MSLGVFRGTAQTVGRLHLCGICLMFFSGLDWDFNETYKKNHFFQLALRKKNPHPQTSQNPQLEPLSDVLRLPVHWQYAKWRQVPRPQASLLVTEPSVQAHVRVQGSHPRRGRSLAPGLQDTPVSSLCTPARCGCWWGCEMCGSKCAVVSGSWFRVQSSSHLSGLTGVSSLNVNANNWRQTPKHIFLP